MDQNKKPLYIFLDIDGVLNNYAAFKLNKKTIYVLSHENMTMYQRLYDLLSEKYDIKVVLSSTWRFHKTGINEINKLSKKYPAMKFSSTTLLHHGNRRGNEIETYCKTHNIDINDILILDDDYIEIDSLRKRHLRTHCQDGLRYSDILYCLNELVDYYRRD